MNDLGLMNNRFWDMTRHITLIMMKAWSCHDPSGRSHPAFGLNFFFFSYSLDCTFHSLKGIAGYEEHDTTEQPPGFGDAFCHFQLLCIFGERVYWRARTKHTHTLVSVMEGRSRNDWERCRAEYGSSGLISCTFFTDIHENS